MNLYAHAVHGSFRWCGVAVPREWFSRSDYVFDDLSDFFLPLARRARIEFPGNGDEICIIFVGVE